MLQCHLFVVRSKSTLNRFLLARVDRKYRFGRSQLPIRVDLTCRFGYIACIGYITCTDSGDLMCRFGYIAFTG